MGVNLNTWKAYVRLKFRTEPVSVSEVGDGISCAGKVRNEFMIILFSVG